MQMMTVLKPIAFDVILCMSQLFDYYLYTVGHIFHYLTVLKPIAFDVILCMSQLFDYYLYTVGHIFHSLNS